MLEFLIWLKGADTTLFLFINKSLANGVTDAVMPFVTADLHLKIFYALSLGAILWKGNRRLRWAVLFSLITVAVTDLTSSAFLKPLFARPRPCWELTVHLLVPCGAGFSLPSSHAANLFGQAYFFKAVAPKSVKYLIPLAVIVSLSRVFVGVHYPADILFGAALGTVIGVIVGGWFVKIYSHFLDKKSLKSEGVDNANKD